MRNLPLLGFFLISLSACTPSLHLKNPASARDLVPESTYLALDYLFETKDPVIQDSGCSVTFKDLKTGEEVVMDLPAKGSWALAEIPTPLGERTLTHLRFYCHSRAQWEHEKNKLVFSVAPQKINYLGFVHITETPENNGLLWMIYPEVKKASHSISKELSREDRARLKKTSR